MINLKQTRLPQRPTDGYNLPVRPKWSAILLDSEGKPVAETKEQHQARFAAFQAEAKAHHEKWMAAAKKAANPAQLSLLTAMDGTHPALVNAVKNKDTK
jgi:hypothetical protein